MSIGASAVLPLSVAVGTAVGGAASQAIAPELQAIVNESWKLALESGDLYAKPPSYFMMAEGVAKGRVDPNWAQARANEQGISSDAFQKLTQIANIGPGIDVAFELWRRNLIGDADFARAVKEEALDDGWLKPLQGLKERLLTPAELANARQQEFIKDDRLHAEGELQGYTNERMDLMFKMAGLPPGPMEGLEMLRRNIITAARFGDIVAEGHTKTKYTDNLLALQHHVISGYEAAGLWLRGWLTQAQAEQRAALDGWQPAELELLYKNRGRPAAPGQMYTALARGVVGPDGVPMDYDQFKKGIQESDIRTEWVDTLWGIRFLYPSLFQLNRLVTSGAIDAATGADWAHKARYAPEVVTALEAAWGGQGSTTGAKWVTRAESGLYTAAHNEYVSLAISNEQARTALSEAGITGAEQDEVVRLWDAEIAISRLQLTIAEIRREYRKNVLSVDDAHAELMERGMTYDDATRYLQG